MLFRPIAPRKPRPRQLRPTLDPLETRRLMAAKVAPQVSIVETPDGAGSVTIQVTGTSRNDNIFVTDDGKHAAGSLRITANGIPLFINTAPFSFVTIATGAGRDRVSYNLAGGLAAGPSQNVSISSAGQNGISNRGGGNLQVTANLAGSIAANSSLTLLVSPDPKASTTLNVAHSGTVDGNLIYGLTPTNSNSTNVRTGPTTFTAISTATVGASGLLGIGQIGGASRNLMQVDYNGTNNGELFVFGSGRGAKDVLTASLAMNAGSTGTVGQNTPAQLMSTGKNARVQFLIARGTDTTSMTGIVAQLSTTSKQSVTVHTANVMTLSAGKDTVVS